MEFLCEHVVERKKKGLYRYYGAAVIAAWIFGPLLFVGICFGLSSIPGAIFEMFKWSMFLIPLFVYLGIKIGPITYAYTQISYEYNITLGEISFAKIFSDRFRKDWFSMKISDFEVVAPYSGIHKNDLPKIKYDKVVFSASSMDAPHLYYATFNNNQGKKCILFFEMTKKSLRLFKTYNPSTVMTQIPD